MIVFQCGDIYTVLFHQLLALDNCTTTIHDYLQKTYLQKSTITCYNFFIMLKLHRKLLTDNYSSVTKKHFLASNGSDGNDPFSNELYLKPTSGFVKDIPVTIPRFKQVNS